MVSSYRIAVMKCVHRVEHVRDLFFGGGEGGARQNTLQCNQLG